MKMKRKQGFTLVEIMIVVLIIGMLATIAVPSFMKARENSQTNACINNLRQIDAAKEQLALEDNAAQGAKLIASDVDAFIKGGAPTCPGGGTYTYNKVGTDPACSISEHVLDSD